MIEIDGFTHKEVADKLGITASASRSQLTKAKKALREKLELARS
jgi:RNA polymerase sigma-70 factor (ECF subfamily)